MKPFFKIASGENWHAVLFKNPVFPSKIAKDFKFSIKDPSSIAVKMWHFCVNILLYFLSFKV